MTAQIVVDDGTNPPAAGTAERDASYLSAAFTLSNFNNAGVLGWRWTLVDRPLGSAAALSSTSAALTQITPDVHGAYSVRLETYRDAARTQLDGADEQIVSIAFPAPQDWHVPAAGETTQRGARGWATPVETTLRQIRAELGIGSRAAIRADAVVTVKADFQYHLHGSITVDPDGTFTLEPDSQLVIA